MANQNVTLSIPKDILRKVKHLAIEKNTSISGLLVKTLTDLVKKEDVYKKARERHLRVLNSKLNLETKGKTSWSRSDLHER